jgi:hypothetical protein
MATPQKRLVESLDALKELQDRAPYVSWLNRTRTAQRCASPSSPPKRKDPCESRNAPRAMESNARPRGGNQDRKGRDLAYQLYVLNNYVT